MKQSSLRLSCWGWEFRCLQTGHSWDAERKHLLFLVTKGDWVMSVCPNATRQSLAQTDLHCNDDTLLIEEVFHPVTLQTSPTISCCASALKSLLTLSVSGCVIVFPNKPLLLPIVFLNLPPKKLFTSALSHNEKKKKKNIESMPKKICRRALFN